jgi:hypothetical protein
MAPRLVTDQMLDLFIQEGRSPGKHVSSAIYRIMESLYPDRFGGDPIDPIRANLGNAMEHAIIEAMAREHPDRYARPGQLVYEGIYGTPDLWDLREWATTEVKLTWASSRRAEDIEDSWFSRYWWQLKAYAKMAMMTKGRLIIIFINGDYRGGQPEGMMWEDEWSQDELDENWAMIKSYATKE